MLSDVSELFNEPVIAPATDRRLTRRVVDVWARAARGHFPSWKAMQEMTPDDDLQWMFAVDCEKSVGFPYFIYVGSRIGKVADVFLCGADEFGLSLLDKATADINAARAQRAPHFREETLKLCDGRRVMMRAVTAPLADDGHTVSHVVGAVNGRFPTDTARMCTSSN